MGFFPTTHAVFGAMADKDIESLLSRMRPLVDAWHFCDLPTARAAKAIDLAALIARLLAALPPGTLPRKVSIATHETPAQALSAAAAAAEAADRIVVFGSFYTVGGVLKNGLPRLTAPHLG